MDSYETILGRMKGKYRELSGYEVPEMSDIDIRMKVLAGEIYSGEINLDFVKRQLLPTTATGEFLDNHASDRGLTRLPAVKASGTVQFYVNAPNPNDIFIPQGTIVSSGGRYPVRYSTDEGVTLAHGTDVVSAPCSAISGGVNGNAAAGTVNNLITGVAGIDRVTNLYPIQGGCDAESDEELRARILRSYKTISNGVNEVYYESLALSVEGVTSASVVAGERGEGTVNIYIRSQRLPSTPELVNRVRILVSQKRGLNTDIMVFPAEDVEFDVGVEVKLKPGYSIDVVTQNIRNSINTMLDCTPTGESVYENHIGQAVMNSEGVSDYNWLGNYRNMCAVEPGEFAVLGDLEVVEAEV
jgi:uncharacterized phage protein gp47/JayE